MSTKGKSRLRDGEIRYGNVQLTDEEYAEAQNPKVRTTIFLEKDLITAYKALALKKGVKYQQLIRDTLKEALDSKGRIEDRIKRLEEKVFKKRA